MVDWGSRGGGIEFLVLWYRIKVQSDDISKREGFCYGAFAPPVQISPLIA